MDNTLFPDSVITMKNRLSSEKSPYLLQHSSNPVDWYPWGPEAFSRAEREDRPIFLSIGYSTCHWCHVMEKESFEDSTVADMINRAFIPVKVDREERPDIDSLYMDICMMLSGKSGWPLTIIMTPQKKPFLAATYIPRESRYGARGLLELIPEIEELWKNQRYDVENYSEEIASLLDRQESGNTEKPPLTVLLQEAENRLTDTFDPVNGGFGSRPKFPAPQNLLFLLRQWYFSGRTELLQMVTATLKGIRAGGIFDNIGYGIHRYSTDARWLVPHFEKMLYDQALCAMACCEAYQSSRRPFLAEMAREIFTYVLRDMISPDGGFYSAEDADSDGREGAFYLWTADEIQHIDGASPGMEAMKIFNVREQGNYPDESGGESSGQNILHLGENLDLLEKDRKLKEKYDRAREALLLERSKRQRPLLDDKILTDWNGLMIASLSTGSRILRDQKLLAAAERAAAFILSRLSGPDDILLHRFHRGESGIDGFLDDYAFFVWGLIELYQASLKSLYLEKALSFSEKIMELFSASDGGLYHTSSEGEKLLTRKKIYHDGAIPSAVSVAAMNFIRLGRITGNPQWEDRAERLMESVPEVIKEHPAYHTSLLSAWSVLVNPFTEAVISANETGRETDAILEVLNSSYSPAQVIAFHPAERNDGRFSPLRPPVNGRATVYICHDRACNSPVTDMESLKRTLDGYRPAHVS